MSEFKVEHSVAIKGSAHGKSKGAPEKYPISQLKVGDSFLVSCADSERRMMVRRMSGVCQMRKRFGTAQGWSFVVRTVDGGVRVWRIA